LPSTLEHGCPSESAESLSASHQENRHDQPRLSRISHHDEPRTHQNSSLSFQQLQEQVIFFLSCPSFDSLCL
jgi:hypothetical protein